MVIESVERRTLRSPDDVILARRLVRDVAIAQGLTLVEQTKLITAASELARNALVHGGGGEMHLEVLREGNRNLPRRHRTLHHHSHRAAALLVHLIQTGSAGPEAASLASC